MDLVGVFEYLIGNTDWSVIMRHNVRLVQVAGRDLLYPVAYDWITAGLVNASYARPDPRMPIKSVRQRLYRGMCRSVDQITPTLARLMAAHDSIALAWPFTGILNPNGSRTSSETSTRASRTLPRRRRSCQSRVGLQRTRR